MQNLIWQRAPQPRDDYALMLTNPEDVNFDPLNARFARVKNAKGDRKKSLSTVAITAFEKWLDDPSHPLPSKAYALLSNWFLTELKVDREGSVSRSCGDFWDALFAIRPPKRLTQTRDKKNSEIIDIAFEVWWTKQEASQGR